MGMLEDDLDEFVKEAGWIGRKFMALYNQHAWWSRQTFGADDERGPLGPIRHLKKEAEELEKSPTDRMEYADCFLLLLDASRRAGIDVVDLVDAAKEKLDINEKREWPASEDGQPCEHIETTEPMNAPTPDITKAPVHIHAFKPRRDPDFKIGPPDDPYMLRWWLIPRNEVFNIYYHQIRHDDEDRALHDHPWPSFSYLIRGEIREITEDGHRDLVPGDCVYREAEAAHRLELLSDQAETLFITGPVIRDWGFHCPQGWKHWKDFVNPDDPGAPGRGCGEG